MQHKKIKTQRQKQLLRSLYLAAVLASSVYGAPVWAQNAQWDGPGSDWNTGTNWDPDTVPTNVATFGQEGNDQPTVGLSTNANINDILFVEEANAYTINTNAFRLSIDQAGTGGIVNDSGTTQTFNVNNAAGILRFRNNASIFEFTVDEQVVINNNSGGLVRFEDDSDAGSSTINNSNNSALRFFENSSAATAVINNTTGGDTEFNGTSTAGDSTISNDGAGSTTTFTGGGRAGTSSISNTNGGTTTFNGVSRAENSEITNSNGGATIFNDDANGNTAFITNQSGGSLFINDSADTGNMTVENQAGGVVDISGTSGAGAGIGLLFGAGDVVLGTQTLRTGMLNQDANISGIISGTGGLTKEGTATLRLQGDNTYTGPTTVNDGTLQVDGSITSETTVGTDGRVSGTGTIISNLINNGGNIAPGRGTDAVGNSNIYGDLNVTGDVTINGDDSRLETRVNGFGDVNRLEAIGTINLDGGVDVTAEDPSTGGEYLVTNRYRIATGDTGRNGTFDQGVTNFSGPSYLDPTLEYNATSALLFLRRNTLDDQDGDFSDNQDSVFDSFNNAIENGDPLTEEEEEIINNFILNGAGALSLASGDALTVYPVLAQNANNRFNQRLLTQLLQQAQSNPELAKRIAPRLVYSGTRYGSLLAQAGTPVYVTTAAEANRAAAHRSSIWATIARADEDGDSDGNGPGFDADATEYQVGINRRVTDRTTIGLSIGKSDGDVNVPERAAEGDLDTTSIGAYARYDANSWYASGLLSYSSHDIESRRETGLGTASADFDARTWALWGEVGKKIARSGWNIEPNVSAKFSNTKQDEFDESGPGGLSVNSENYNSRRLGLGVRITNADANARIRPHLFLGYEREFGDTNAELTNQLGGLSAFRVEGSDLGKNIFSARLGADARLNDRFSLIGEIGASWRSNQDSQYIYGGVKYGF